MQINALTGLFLAFAIAASAQAQVGIGDVPPDALGTDRQRISRKGGRGKFLGFVVHLLPQGAAGP